MPTSACRPAVSGAIDDRADQFDYLPPPDAVRGVAGSDLRDRLTGLAGAHPSSADYSGWPGSERVPESGERPDLALPVEVVMPAGRRAHILDGEPGDGGGHRAGTGRPGKTEFPVEWTDDRIVDAVLSVARYPDQPPARQANDRWRVAGTRDGVSFVAIVESGGGVWTAWPREGSPGVVKNEKQRTDDGRI